MPKGVAISIAGSGRTKNAWEEAVSLADAKTSTSFSNTGYVTGSSSSGNAIFNTVWWNSGGIVVWTSAGQTSTVAGYSGSIGQVTGCLVKLIDTYDPLNQGDRSLDVQISFDGGSTFSTASGSGALGNTSTTDIQIGSRFHAWGLTPPTTLDLSDVRVKGTNVNGVVYSKQAQIKLYYSTVSTTEDVDVTVTKNDGSDLKDSSQFVWHTNVFNSINRDTWQMHTTGSHNNKEIVFTSNTHGWNFIPHDWPSVEEKFNSKTDPEGNTFTVNKKMKSWR